MTVFVQSLFDAGLFLIGGAMFLGICNFVGRTVIRYCNVQTRKNPRHFGRGA